MRQVAADGVVCVIDWNLAAPRQLTTVTVSREQADGGGGSGLRTDRDSRAGLLAGSAGTGTATARSGLPIRPDRGFVRIGHEGEPSRRRPHWFHLS